MQRAEEPNRLEKLRTVRRTLRRCAAAQLGLHALLAVLSVPLAASSPFGVAQPKEWELFRRTFGRVPLLVAPSGAGASQPWAAPASRWLQAACLGGVLIGLTASFAIAARTLARADETTCRSVRATVRNVAWAVGLIALVAYPICTQDIWHSIAWGRMIASGVNPYYRSFTPESLRGLPLEFYDTRMTYGPLWGLACAAVAAAAGARVWFSLIGTKALLLGTWIAALTATARLARLRSASSEALALCLFGWIPLSAHLAIGEGHNDIALEAGLLLWIAAAYGAGASRTQVAAPLALGASVLLKLVTAPLAVLELRRALRAGAWRRNSYWVSVVITLAIAGLLVALFARDRHWLDGALAMRRWHFLTPQRAASGIASWLGVPLPARLADEMVKLACLIGAVWGVARYVLRPDLDRLLTATLLLLFAFLFGFAGHVWPWFWIWTLGPAALSPRSGLGRLALAAALLAPFLDLYWVLAPDWKHLQGATIAFYLALVPVAAGVGLGLAAPTGGRRVGGSARSSGSL